MKHTIKAIAVILLICIFVSCFMNFGFAYDQTKYDITPNDGIIMGNLPKILEASGDDDEIDILIWVKYTESFDKSKYEPDKVAEVGKEFHYPRNVAFAKTLPEDVNVTFIDNYAPVVCATATKAQIYKISEMDTVSEIWEGEKYIIYVSESDITSQNKFFNSTLTVNDVDKSFLDNEYYKVYADFYGKYFYEEFKNDSPADKIDSNLYKSIKTVTGEHYITIILDEAITAENIAKALNIREEAIVAICQSYPVAMIKIDSDAIDNILLNENVSAVYAAFPAATEPGMVTDEIMEETYSPTAADARKILRYSAKKFFFMSDADLDGRITSADARIALRISAKLESGKTYSKSNNGSDAFWQESYKEQWNTDERT